VPTPGRDAVGSEQATNARERTMPVVVRLEIFIGTLDGNDVLSRRSAHSGFVALWMPAPETPCMAGTERQSAVPRHRGLARYEYLIGQVLVGRRHDWRRRSSHYGLARGGRCRAATALNTLAVALAKASIGSRPKQPPTSVISIC
jgi:hypothetical protein